METVDFRTFKQKRNSFCNKAKVTFQNGWYTVKRTVQEHPMETFGLLMAAVPGTLSCINSVIRVNQQNKERRFDMRHEYDNRTGEHWYARKDVTNNQKLEIERRYRNGESKGEILRSMRLL